MHIVLFIFYVKNSLRLLMSYYKWACLWNHSLLSIGKSRLQNTMTNKREEKKRKEKKRKCWVKKQFQMCHVANPTMQGNIATYFLLARNIPTRLQWKIYLLLFPSSINQHMLEKLFNRQQKVLTTITHQRFRVWLFSSLDEELNSIKNKTWKD